VGLGSLIFVPSRIPHESHYIKEELKLLVFFSPPESQA